MPEPYAPNTILQTYYWKKLLPRGFTWKYKGLAQQTRGIHPMLFQCWPIIFDAGPTLKQNWMNAPGLLGIMLIFELVKYDFKLQRVNPGLSI